GVRLRAGSPWQPSLVAADCMRGDLDRGEMQVRIDELVARCGATIGADLAHWSPDVDGALNPTLKRIEASTTFRAGSWDCTAGGPR
ncbi:MAG: hypothetical protein ACRELB_24310, partial [Polyangiaceae bacterium]